MFKWIISPGFGPRNVIIFIIQSLLPLLSAWFGWLSSQYVILAIPLSFMEALQTSCLQFIHMEWFISPFNYSLSKKPISVGLAHFHQPLRARKHFAVMASCQLAPLNRMQGIASHIVITHDAMMHGKVHHVMRPYSHNALWCLVYENVL